MKEDVYIDRGLRDRNAGSRNAEALDRILANIERLGLKDNLIELEALGYTRIDGVLSADQVERARAAILKRVEAETGNRIDLDTATEADFRDLTYVYYMLYEDEVFEEILMQEKPLALMTYLLGEMGKSVLDLPAMIEELGAGIRAKAADDFASRGMNITSCYVESISPTEETAKAIDEAAAMGAIGDMGAYMQFQAARAMRDAAQSEGGGGVAGAGVGLGAGAGMGMAMAQMMSQAMQGGQQPQQAAQQVAQAAEQLTPEQVQAALDNLAVRLANGEISEEIYTKLSAQLEKKLGG